jgi:hypothetical protein
MSSAAPPDLDVYEIAFLAGGPLRVVDTAVVALVRNHRLRVHATGRLATAQLTRRHPVEAAVLDAVGPTGHRSVDTISWRLHDDPRLNSVGERLQEAGLLSSSHAVLRLTGDRRSLVPTRAGRHVLGTLDALTGPEELRVALGGREAMVDSRLRAEIFEPPFTSLTPPRGHGRSRDVDHSDPQLAAYRTGGPAAMAGVFGLFGDAW